MQHKFNTEQDIFLEQIAKKVFYILNSKPLERALFEKRLSYLLAEAVSEEELKGLDERAAEARSDVDALLQILPEQMSDTAAYFKELQEKLPSPGTVAGIEIAGNEKAAAGELGDVVATLDQVNNLKKSFLDAVSLLRNELADLAFVSELQDAPTEGELYVLYNEKSLKELADWAEENGKDFPSATALAAGIEGSYKDPPKPKGFLEKIVGFFFGGDPSDDLQKVYSTELLEKVPFKSFVDFVLESDAQKGDAATDVSQDAKATEELATDLEALQVAAKEGPAKGGEPSAEEGLTPEEVKQADEEAEKVAADVGGGPLSKAELTALLKKYPDIVGQGPKATRQRRIFRNAINKAAGTAVFEEGKLIVPVQISKKSEDELIKSRWMRIAGVEEE